MSNKASPSRGAGRGAALWYQVRFFGQQNMSI